MKARLLAVLLVSTLVLASAAPVAFAQAERDPSVQYVDCSQVQSAFGSQYGNANANAVVESEATAEVAQELNITQDQVNACLGNVGEEENEGTNEKTNASENTNAKESTAAGESTVPEARDGEENVLAGTDPGGKLPETGGPGGFALAAGCALLGLGLIFNRIAR